MPTHNLSPSPGSHPFWPAVFFLATVSFTSAQVPNESENDRAAAAILPQAQKMEQLLTQIVASRHVMTDVVRARLAELTQKEAADEKARNPWIRAHYPLYRSVHLFGALAAQNPDYPPAVAELMLRLDRQDKRAFNLFFRLQNALYRSVEVSGLWAAQVGVESGAVEDVFTRMRFGDRQTRTALEQAQNGAYRLAEMLSLIARQSRLDAAKINTISDAFTAGNAQAKNLYQQLENGLRSVNEWLGLIAAAPPSVPAKVPH